MIDVTERRAEQTLQQDVVYALAESAGAIYAARASGLYRSADGGATWKNATTALQSGGSFTVAAVAARGSAVFAGSPGAVLCSYDDGESWQLVGLASPPPNVTALEISPNYTEDGLVAAATAEDGVFISTDRGAHWTAWNFGLIDHHVFALAFSPGFAADRTLYAGTESGICRSKNGGRGWQELPFPMDAAPVLCLELSPHFTGDGLLYAGTEKNGLVVSGDFGMNWRPGTVSGPSTAVHAIQVISAPDPEIWLLLEDNLLNSADGGASWQPHGGQIPMGKLAMTMLPLSTAPGKVLVGFADGDILPLG